MAPSAPRFDGVLWQARATGTTEHFNAVTYRDGVFAAVGAGGTIRVSNNGTVWGIINSGSTAALEGVA